MSSNENISNIRILSWKIVQKISLQEHTKEAIQFIFYNIVNKYIIQIDE